MPSLGLAPSEDALANLKRSMDDASPAKEETVVTGWKDKLLQFYIDREALAFGNFTLASGKTSDFYIDSRTVTTHPQGLRLIAQAFAQIIENQDLLPPDANLITPGGVSGIPIGTALALELDIPFVIDRGAQKAHGLGKRFEGKFSTNNRCLVVDDLVTAGGTILKTVQALRDEGYTVSDALVVVDREEGGREELAKLGVKLHALVTKADLRRALERYGENA